MLGSYGGEVPGLEGWPSPNSGRAEDSHQVSLRHFGAQRRSLRCRGRRISCRSLSLLQWGRRQGVRLLERDRGPEHEPSDWASSRKRPRQCLSAPSLSSRPAISRDASWGRQAIVSHSFLDPVNGTSKPPPSPPPPLNLLLAHRRGDTRRSASRAHRPSCSARRCRH